MKSLVFDHLPQQEKSRRLLFGEVMRQLEEARDAVVTAAINATGDREIASNVSIQKLRRSLDKLHAAMTELQALQRQPQGRG